MTKQDYDNMTREQQEWERDKYEKAQQEAEKLAAVLNGEYGPAFRIIDGKEVIVYRQPGCKRFLFLTGRTP